MARTTLKGNDPALNLKTAKGVASFLNTNAEDGNPSVFIDALRKVAHAQRLSFASNREPTLKDFMNLISKLKLAIHFAPLRKKRGSSASPKAR